MISSIFRGDKKSVDVSGYPPDKVVHFQFVRGAWCPGLSPFTIKFETYLRWTKKPHIVSDMVYGGMYKTYPWPME